jgi:hypothetical protein
MYSTAAEAIAALKNTAGSHHPCIARILTMMARKIVLPVVLA